MTDVLSTLTKQMLFSPLAGAGRTETIVGRIRSAIMLGIFADGEQLPNEIDLAAQFQVSPVTLRDALRVVRDEGLAQTKRGRSGGTFVIAPAESNMDRFEERLAAHSALSLRDLLDWQAALVSQCAYLAATRASERESLGLMAAVDNLSAAESAPRARRLSSRLLIEISAASRSARLSREMITHLIESSPHAMLAYRDPEVLRASTAHGMNMVKAIQNRDAELAATRALEYVGYLGDRILELRHSLTRSAQRLREDQHA